MRNAKTRVKEYEREAITRRVITFVRNRQNDGHDGKSEKATCYRIKRRISIEFTRKQEERRAEFSFTRA